MDGRPKSPAPPTAHAMSADVECIENVSFKAGVISARARLADGRRGVWSHRLGAPPGSQDPRFKILPAGSG